MSRQIFKFIDGKFTEIYNSEATESASAFVHTDEMHKPLTNMVTGKKYTSKAKYIKDVKAQGLEIVGNDLLSKRKHVPKVTLTDEMILDRMDRAESILNDPAKYRARQNENLERLERYEKLIHGNRR